MVELWKVIEGYEDSYEVSNLGRVRSLTRIDSLGRTRYGKVLKPCFDGKHKYLHVNLQGKSINIHRLVAKAFIENPNNYNEVNHKDEDKTNNCVTNLEWCDHKYNNNYGSKLNSTLGVKNPMCKLTEEDVITIRNEYKPYSKTSSLKVLSNKYGISQSHLSHIINRSRWGWLL